MMGNTTGLEMAEDVIAQHGTDEPFAPYAVYDFDEDTLSVLITQKAFFETDENGVQNTVWFRYIDRPASQGGRLYVGMRVQCMPLGLYLDAEMPLLDFFDDLMAHDPRIIPPLGLRNQLEELRLVITMS